MYSETINISLPKLRVNASFANINPPNTKICAPHYHDELEFLPVYSGEMICTVDGVAFRAKEGEVIFVNSGVPHFTSTEIGCKTGLLQFAERDFLDLEVTKIIKYSVKFQELSSVPVRILKIPDLWDAIETVRNEQEKKEPGYDMMIKGAIYRILGIIYREEILSDTQKILRSKEMEKILPALSYINTNYYEPLTLEDVSSMLGFDQSYFCRIFKSATGATFTEYLNFVRVCKSEKLLSRTDDSVLEISEAVGFSSVSYFDRVFKKYKNSSPRHYRTAKYIAISKGEKESG